MTPTAARATPPPVGVLRLTGEQLGSIEPPLHGDWFLDFDEYEDFMPLGQAQPAPALDVEQLTKAIGTYWTKRYGLPFGERDGQNREAAEELAREYAAAYRGDPA